jgi:hypothetical protein
MMMQMIKLLILKTIISLQMDSTKIELINPDGQTITFYKVAKEERKRLLREEVECLVEVWKLAFLSLPIHRLKNGDLLLEKTKEDYAFVFKDDQNLQLYKITNSYYITSVHFERDTMYYMFSLTYLKCAQLKALEDKTLISGYESKQYDPIRNQNCDYKTYLLSDNSVFRVFQVTDNNLYGAWFPNMKSFEYFYFSDYTP